MKKQYTFLLLLFVSHLGYTQSSHKAYLTLADSLFRHHNYQDAAMYYKRAIKNSKQPGDIMLKVALSFSEMNNVTEAEPWFKSAMTNNASFSKDDTYRYVNALVMLKKRKEAEAMVQNFLKTHPNDSHARLLLDDLQNSNKYYKDSLEYQVAQLSLNTPEPEFAPSYYKEGIVFNSAQPESITKKKYHWDNSHFLNLYYSAKISDQNFQKPVPFDKELNTSFHDGPVAFYNKGERMILNRNKKVRLPGSEDVYMSHLALFDVQRNEENKLWEVTPLPFDEPPYSFGHPSISEDGNTLYFISDKPGGYGGTDIYRAVRIDGKWSTPYNLGPTINTGENEVFPFYIANTLYFASDGHGGLGGLDIFKSAHSVNGFAPPVNLAYPVNSHLDDFSLITTIEQQSGYFSSSRKGSDDLFEFRKLPDAIKMMARIYDGVTQESVDSADIKLITLIQDDILTTSTKGGSVPFELARETDYILVAQKDGKLGMLSGTAIAKEDYQHVVHQVPLFVDSTHIPCVGIVKNSLGITQNVSSVEIVDETTGEKTFSNEDQSLISFLGEKGHTYKIKIQTAQGDSAIHRLEIKSDDNAKTWDMVLNESPAPVTMAAQVLDSNTNMPLAGARVTVITLDNNEQELTADENGMVEFTLPKGAAYTLVGSKDGLTGTHNGIADNGTDKESVVHSILAKTEPAQSIPVIAVVTNSEGDLLDNGKATIINKLSGDSVQVIIEKGILNFIGEEGKEYSIRVEQDGYNSMDADIQIPDNGLANRKMAIVLQKTKALSHNMAAHLFNETDQSPMVGANVKIVSFSESDQELIANAEGIVEFTLSDGAGYIISGEKDGFTGMYMGVAENGMDKTFVTHQVPLNNDPNSALQIFGMVRDNNGAPVSNVEVTVTDLKTGENISATVVNGILAFPGKRGGQYHVTVSADNYSTQEVVVPIDSSTTIAAGLVFVLDKKIPVTVKVANKKGEALNNGAATIVNKATGEKFNVEIKDGVLLFTGEQGKEYEITITHDDYQTAVVNLSIPQHAQTADELSITLTPKVTENNNFLMAARVFKESDNSPLVAADVRVISFTLSDINLTTDSVGVVEFSLPERSAYIVLASKDGYLGMHSGLAESGMDKNSIIHPIPTTLEPEDQLPVVAFVMDERGKPLKHAQVTVTDNVTGQPVNAKIENGMLSFYGKKGADYSIEITAEDYETQVERIKIEPNATSVEPFEISVGRKKLLALSKATNLIILNNEIPKLYLTSDNGHDEIVEKDGMLYLQSKEEEKLIGRGTLAELIEDPSRTLGLSEDQTIILQNIYFDYNTASLDQTDKDELNKAKNIMNRYPLLQLTVRAHADMRGSSNYNMGLTRKRARAIKSYLVAQGIKSRNVFTRAYGKSAPAVVCETEACTEKQHQQNRRAEFMLTSLPKAKFEPLALTKPQTGTATSTAREHKSSNYTRVLEKYGDRQHEGLTFKVCVGAYRYNPDLTFAELSDLGQLEKQLVAGINYYYLHDFLTLKEAENIRLQVIERGISDAYIVIFFQGGKIPFSKFITVAE